MTENSTYTLEECKRHTSDKDCWLVVHGKVYNVTDFLEEHPGGYDIILTSAGEHRCDVPVQLSNAYALGQQLKLLHL